MVKLVDTRDLSSLPTGCRFDSCRVYKRLNNSPSKTLRDNSRSKINLLFAEVAQLVELLPSKQVVESSSLFFRSKQNKSNIGWISTIERELGSHRIATFTESTNAPSCHVGDPALCGHASGNGEQTIE